MPIEAKRLPLISKELMEAITQAFKTKPIKPNSTTIHDVMYEAGQQSVVQWLQHRMQGTDIISKPND